MPDSINIFSIHMPGEVLKSVKINEEGARSIYLSSKDGQRLLSTGILSETLYKILLKYNQCQVKVSINIFEVYICQVWF